MASINEIYDKVLRKYGRSCCYRKNFFARFKSNVSKRMVDVSFDKRGSVILTIMTMQTTNTRSINPKVRYAENMNDDELYKMIINYLENGEC